MVRIVCRGYGTADAVPEHVERAIGDQSLDVSEYPVPWVMM